MFGFVKSLVLMSAVVGGSLAASAPEAEAGGWGVSFYSGGVPGYYGNPYGGPAYGGGVYYPGNYGSYYRGYYGVPYGGNYWGGYYGGGHHHHHCR